jgi:hypothetical protein
METEGSSPCSQKPSIVTYPAAVESIAYLYNPFALDLVTYCQHVYA